MPDGGFTVRPIMYWKAVCLLPVPLFSGCVTGFSLISSSSESEERAKSVADSDGVIVVPAFTGLGAPYWRADVKGAMFGLTRGTRQEHIIRATLESLAFQSCDVIAAMEEDAGMPIQRLQVDGGASRNEFLMQFQSDLLNAGVIRSTISE